MDIRTQMSLVKKITEIAKLMPLERTMQLYQFALSLKRQSTSIYQENQEEINRDEAVWQSQFVATPDDNLAAMVASVEAEISNGKVLPMFNENGDFIECQ